MLKSVYTVEGRKECADDLGVIFCRFLMMFYDLGSILVELGRLLVISQEVYCKSVPPVPFLKLEVFFFF